MMHPYSILILINFLILNFSLKHQQIKYVSYINTKLLHKKSHVIRPTSLSNEVISRSQPLFGSDIADFSTFFLSATADYAAEIEMAVGEEVYSPIFKAGLFLFVSGIISTVIAGFIISKADSWEDLDDEFQRGKESQLIPLDNTRRLVEVSNNDIVDDAKVEEKSLAEVASDQQLQDIKYLDL
eukprot:gene11548-15467_t